VDEENILRSFCTHVPKHFRFTYLMCFTCTERIEKTHYQRNECLTPDEASIIYHNLSFKSEKITHSIFARNTILNKQN
jgi:hypothetical protein